MKGAVSGEAGVTKAPSGVLGVTAFNRNRGAKGTGTVVGRRARSETQLPAAGWEALWCNRGVCSRPRRSPPLDLNFLSAAAHPPGPGGRGGGREIAVGPSGRMLPTTTICAAAVVGIVAKGGGGVVVGAVGILKTPSPDNPHTLPPDPWRSPKGVDRSLPSHCPPSLHRGRAAGCPRPLRPLPLLPALHHLPPRGALLRPLSVRHQRGPGPGCGPRGDPPPAPLRSQSRASPVPYRPSYAKEIIGGVIRSQGGGASTGHKTCRDNFAHENAIIFIFLNRRDQCYLFFS